MTEMLNIQAADGVCTVALNRPDLHNAFNAELIQSLSDTFTELNANNDIRVVVLTGAGKSFSAGADLNWMRSMADASEAENRDDSIRLAAMFRAINNVNKPVIARVNGHAFGGGVGMLACVDMVIAVDSAKFGLTEVKLGLIPATIAPLVQAKIGQSQMRRYAVSGEVMDARQAQRIGLVHEVVPIEALDDTVNKHIELFRQAGPVAAAECKRLVQAVAGLSGKPQNEQDAVTAEWIARLRVSAEGQHGLRAFLDKEEPDWRKR